MVIIPQPEVYDYMNLFMFYPAGPRMGLLGERPPHQPPQNMGGPPPKRPPMQNQHEYGEPMEEDFGDMSDQHISSQGPPFDGPPSGERFDGPPPPGDRFKGPPPGNQRFTGPPGGRFNNQGPPPPNRQFNNNELSSGPPPQELEEQYLPSRSNDQTEKKREEQ